MPSIRSKVCYVYFFKNTSKHCGVGNCELSTDFFWVEMTMLIVDGNGIFVVGFLVMTFVLTNQFELWQGTWWYSNLKTLWFYLYVNCQTLAYIIGIAGWAIGINLGNQTSSLEYSGHVTIDIFLFVLGTL